MSNVRKLATYTREFKLEAIQLAENKGSIPRTAKELGISDKSLYKWIKEHAADNKEAFRGRGKLTAEAEELRQLRLENKSLKETNEILKKATKFFVSQSK